MFEIIWKNHKDWIKINKNYKICLPDTKNK